MRRCRGVRGRAVFGRRRPARTASPHPRRHPPQADRPSRVALLPDRHLLDGDVLFDHVEPFDVDSGLTLRKRGLSAFLPTERSPLVATSCKRPSPGVETTSDRVTGARTSSTEGCSQWAHARTRCACRLPLSSFLVVTRNCLRVPQMARICRSSSRPRRAGTEDAIRQRDAPGCAEGEGPVPPPERDPDDVFPGC